MSEAINLFDRLHAEAVAELGRLPAAGNDDPAGSGFSEALIGRCLRLMLRKDRLRIFRRMTHFIAAAEQHRLDALELTFLTVPTMDALRHTFVSAGADDDAEGVTVRYQDGEFDTAYRGMPRLVCALNLASTFLGVDALRERLLEITIAAGRFADLEDIARRWADEFDGYRRKRLGSGQEARNFHGIVEFLQGEFPGSFIPADIHSAHVLGFWRRHATAGELDMQLYGSAHDCFVKFTAAYGGYLAESAERRADSLDAQIADGYDPAFEPAGGVSALEDWLALDEDFPQIKFLLGRQRTALAGIADLPVEAANLLLSALRDACFGALQNRLVESRRRRADRQAMVAQIAAGPAESYADKVAEYGAIREALSQSRSCAAFVLVSNRRSEGVRLLLSAADDTGPLATALGRYGLEHPPTETSFESACQGLFADIAAGRDVPGALRQAIDSARRAWQSNNRAGFRRNQLTETTAVDALDLAAERLPEAIDHVDARLEQLDRQLGAAGGPADAMSSDRSLFAAAFSEMYLQSPAGAPT